MLRDYLTTTIYDKGDGGGAVCGKHCNGTVCWQTCTGDVLLQADSAQGPEFHGTVAHCGNNELLSRTSCTALPPPHVCRI